MSSCGNASVIGGRASKAPAPAAARFRCQTYRGLSSGGWLCKLTRLPSCLALAVAAMALAAVTASAQEADADSDSGSSGLIAFFSTRDGDYEIYPMSPDGSGLSRLTHSPSDDSEPAWSPVCTRMAFTSLLGREQDIYLINPDGSGLSRVTDDPAGDRTIVWSPDGSRIALVSARDDMTEIYSMRADGSDVYRLTNGFSIDRYPLGRRMAAVSPIVPFAMGLTKSTCRMPTVSASCS